MSLIIKVSAFAVVAAILSSLLKESRREFVLPLQIGCVALMVIAVAATAKSRFSDFFSLLQKTQLPIDMMGLLAKGVVVCIVSQLCSSLCRENGNSAIADVIEASGRIITVLLCLPMVEAVLNVAVSFV